MNNIRGKVALVTGGSKGIGASIAKVLVSEGVSKLIIVARKSEKFNDFLIELQSTKLDSTQTVVPLYCDLSTNVGVEALLDAVIHEDINIDILVNNAGLTIPKTIFEASVSELELTMQVNLYAPFSIIQSLLRRGNEFSHIFNIASTAGIKGRAGWATYSASKAALIAFSESLREELLPLGTRVTCISPGRCATDLRKVLAPDEDPSTIMQSDDVARVFTMLLSDVGHYVDSENIVVRL